MSATNGRHVLVRTAAVMGPLRVMLLIIALALAAVGPLCGDNSYLYTSAAGLWLNGVAPAMAVIMAFVLPLDMMMCRIFRADRPAPEYRRYGFIIRYELIAMVILLSAWAPFLLRLMRG